MINNFYSLILFLILAIVLPVIILRNRSITSNLFFDLIIFLMCEALVFFLCFSLSLSLLVSFLFFISFLAFFIYNAPRRLNQFLNNSQVYFLLLISPAIGAYFIKTFLSPIMEWDGFYIWLPRLVLIKQWGDFSLIEKLNFTNVQYPFLGTFIWWICDPFTSSHFARFSFYFLAILLFLGILQKKYDDKNKYYFLYLVLCFYFLINNNYINGYQDALISIVLCLCVLLIQRATSLKQLIIIPLFSVSLMLIKNEGVILSAFVLILSVYRILILENRKIKLKNIIILIFLWCILISLWPLILNHHGREFTKIQNGSFDVKLLLKLSSYERIPFILKRYIEFVSMNKVLIVLVALLLYLKKIELKKFDGIIVFSSYSLVLVVIYTTTLQPLAWHIDTSMERLLGQVFLTLFLCSLGSKGHQFDKL